MINTESTFNQCMVGINGQDVVILMPSARLSKERALNLAAYIVALIDHDDQFPDLLERVRNT